MSLNLRTEMPQTAAWIDSLRAAFGVEQVDPAIRSGMKGSSAFYASENGHEIGCRDTRPGITPAHCFIAPGARGGK